MIIVKLSAYPSHCIDCDKLTRNMAEFHLKIPALPSTLRHFFHPRGEAVPRSVIGTHLLVGLDTLLAMLEELIWDGDLLH